MSHSFAEQLKQQRDTILAERGVMITYKQRDIVIETVPAVPATSNFVNEKNDKRRTMFSEREYTVEFGLLKWNGEQVIPKQGDHIIEGDRVYEVGPREAKQCYRPIDANELYIRIFVQRLIKKA